MKRELRRPAIPLLQRVARKLRGVSRKAQWPLRRALRRVFARRGAPSQIHLSWSEDPATSLTITWHTPTRRNLALAEIRESEHGSSRSVAGTSQPSPAGWGFIHRVVVRDLEPGLRYAYRVSADQGVEPRWSSWYGARTAPAMRETAIDAVFLCDVGLDGRPDGTTGSTTSVLEEIARESPLLYLGGGDYAYGNRDLRHADPGDAIDCWFEQMQPLFARAPLMAQYGNHEVELAERFEDWGPRFAHPPGIDDSRSYSFDVGPVHFVGLYAPGRAPSDRHLVWLERDLSSAAARSAAWRIVFQHAPILAHGRSHPARPEVQAIAPLFARLGVDLHLSGHDQSYERSHPLSDGITRAGAEGDDTTRYPAGAGVVYAKVSPAGKLSERTSGFSRFEAPVPPEIAVRNDQHHHWAVLRITERELDVRIEGLAQDGAPRKTIDHFTLIRGA